MSRYRWRFTALAWVLMASQLFSQSATITDAGIVVVTNDGRALTIPWANTVDIRGDNPSPGPGPNPPPVGVDVTKQVAAIVRGVNDPTGAQVLAVVYKEVAKRKGLTRKQYLDAIKEGSDLALGVTGTANKWKEARAAIGVVVDSVEARGDVDYPKLLKQIADGFESATAEQPALPPELLSLIIQLIMQLLTRLFGGIGS